MEQLFRLFDRCGVKVFGWKSRENKEPNILYFKKFNGERDLKCNIAIDNKLIEKIGACIELLKELSEIVNNKNREVYMDPIRVEIYRSPDMMHGKAVNITSQNFSAMIVDNIVFKSQRYYVYISGHLDEIITTVTDVFMR